MHEFDESPHELARSVLCYALNRARIEPLLDEGVGLVLPTQVDGSPALRFCIVNPRTTADGLGMILNRLA